MKIAVSLSSAIILVLGFPLLSSAVGESPPTTVPAPQAPGSNPSAGVAPDGQMVRLHASGGAAGRHHDSPNLRKILKGAVTMPVIRTLVFGPEGCVNCADGNNPNSGLSQLLQHSSPGVDFSYAGPATTTTTWSYSGAVNDDSSTEESRDVPARNISPSSAAGNFTSRWSPFQYGGSLPTVIQLGGGGGGFYGGGSGSQSPSYNPDSNSTGYQYGGSLPTVIQLAPAP